MLKLAEGGRLCRVATHPRGGMVSLPLERGADVHSRTEDNMMALDIAKRSGNWDQRL